MRALKVIQSVAHFNHLSERILPDLIEVLSGRLTAIGENFNEFSG
jgi:hypothetical protein